MNDSIGVQHSAAANSAAANCAAANGPAGVEGDVRGIPNEARFDLPLAVLRELDAALRRADSPTCFEAGLPSLDVDLCAAAKLMLEVRRELEHGTGFVVLDRLPVERYSVEKVKLAATVLASLVAPVVDQKWGGSPLYEVLDRGEALAHGVRRSITNTEQDYHTDGAWLPYTPAVVGLFCIEQAPSGGGSQVASLAHARDRLAQQDPQLLQRLYQPFHWDRQAEHAPGDVPTSSHPVFAGEEQDFVARCYNEYIELGHGLAGEALDGEGREALVALREALAAGTQYRFRLEPGQFQLINNRKFAHARAAFNDDAEGGRARHLLRLWMRSEGRLRLEG